jgi:hypothetical protein
MHYYIITQYMHIFWFFHIFQNNPQKHDIRLTDASISFAFTPLHIYYKYYFYYFQGQKIKDTCFIS